MLWPRYFSTQEIGAYVLFKTFFQNYFCILRNRMASLSHIYFGMKHHVGKTLQFDHQFFADWSIQSREIWKFVKNVKIATEIEAAIFPSNPFIFEMLSNLNEK